MERDKRIGSLVKGLWESLVRERGASNWGKKLKGSGYVKHRDGYIGTNVPEVTVYDSTAISCFETYCDGFIGYTMPEDDNWMYMMPWRRVGKGNKEYGGYGDLIEEDDLMRFMEDLGDVALREMSMRGAYRALRESYKDSQAIGIGYVCAFEGDKGIVYKEIDPQECCISEGEDGEVEVFLRHYYTNAKDLVRRYKEAKLEHCWNVVRRGGSGSEENNIEVYEAIVPWDYLYNSENGEVEVVGDGKDYGHVVYIETEGEIAEENSFYEMPIFAYSPYRDTDKSPYGDGMISKYVEEIVKLNDMENKKRVLFNKFVNPPMLVHANLSGNYSGKAGAIVYTQDLSGQRAEPLYTGSSSNYTPIVNDIAEAKANLRTLLNADLFRTLMSSTDSRKTAYEVSELKNEAVTLLSMQVGDYTKRVVEPLIKRTLKMKIRASKLELPSGMSTSTALEIVESSTVMMNSVFVRRMQAYLKNQGLLAGLQFIANYAQLEQTQSVQVLNGDAVLRAGLFGVGFPAWAIKKISEVKKEREAQQKQMAEMANSQVNANNSKAFSNVARGMQSAKNSGVSDEELQSMLGGQTSGTR